MYAVIEIGGPADLEALLKLFELLKEFNTWIQNLAEMPKSVKGATFLADRRMLGDVEYGPDDGMLTKCHLEDWMRYCVWVHRTKTCLVLFVRESRFYESAFCEQLQKLKFDYRVQVPGDGSNSCDPLWLRPGPLGPRSLYSSDVVSEPRYDPGEVRRMLKNAANGLRLLEHDLAHVKPLQIR